MHADVDRSLGLSRKGGMDRVFGRPDLRGWVGLVTGVDRNVDALGGRRLPRRYMWIRLRIESECPPTIQPDTASGHCSRGLAGVGTSSC